MLWISLDGEAPSSAALSGHNGPPSGTRGLEAAVTLGIQAENNKVWRTHSHHPAGAGSLPDGSTDSFCGLCCSARPLLVLVSPSEVAGGIHLLHR